MSEYYTRTDVDSLIKLVPEVGIFYLDEHGNWIERPSLIYEIEGDPADGPFYKPYFLNDLVQISEDQAQEVERKVRSGLEVNQVRFPVCRGVTEA